MATIPLTDDLGLDETVEVAPFSSLLNYVTELPALRAKGGDLSKAGGLTLDQPAVTCLNIGLSFDKAITLGPAGTSISVLASANAGLDLIQRTPAQVSLPNVSAGSAPIADGTCYLSFCIEASVGVAAAGANGLLQFGINPGETVDLQNYQSFPLKQGITLLDAVKKTVGNFVLPARSEDLANIPDGCIATVTGTGTLTLSATANLLAVTNPLATVALPSPFPALSVTAGGTAAVGASLEVDTTFQIVARKLDAAHVQLGWYCAKDATVAVTATVSEGVTAGFGTTDLFSTIIGLISSNAAADLAELQKGGLGSDQISAIQGAVKAAANRSLELALSTEISSTQSTGAVFLYNIELAALTDESRQALDQALRGDLSALHTGKLAGITPVQSVFENARQRGVQLNVNLLGILNVGSVSTLTISGSVMYEPVTGALVITDGATAERIRSTAINFGADTQKLRQVMAESFMLTAAYSGSQHQIGAPALSCCHSFFDLQNSTNVAQIGKELRVGTALGLFSAGDATPPPGVTDFGRTMVHATTRYDNALASSLFLDPTGAPLPQEWYEQTGRTAIQLLVSDSDEDAVRRLPAIEDNLWQQMKTTGQPGFAALFPGVQAPFLGAITADYTAIMWWAGAMAGVAERLSAMKQWFQQHASASPDDPEFQKSRQDLAAHLKTVAATTSEQFGEPWGLVAMDETVDRRAGASVLISGPKLVRSKQRQVDGASVASAQV